VLSAHTAQALATRPVSAAIPNPVCAVLKLVVSNNIARLVSKAGYIGYLNEITFQLSKTILTGLTPVINEYSSLPVLSNA
jgi:hypothetical protein